jgi:hypothetical protein
MKIKVYRQSGGGWYEKEEEISFFRYWINTLKVIWWYKKWN